MTGALRSPFQAKRQTFFTVQPLSLFGVLEQPLPA
jgi:hypothetical protein